jgi:drug/metabolite transporter (DMT)-like permease
MLGFCVVAPMGDAVAKLLGGLVPIAELLLVRFAVQALILIPFITVGKRPWKMRGRVLYLTILRTVLHAFGIAMMFTALKYLPLADAVAIAFVMPFLMMVLGHYVLNEEIGWRRMSPAQSALSGHCLLCSPAFNRLAGQHCYRSASR